MWAFSATLNANALKLFLTETTPPLIAQNYFLREFNFGVSYQKYTRLFKPNWTKLKTTEVRSQKTVLTHSLRILRFSHKLSILNFNQFYYKKSSQQE